MEKMEIDSKEKFLAWLCRDYEKMPADEIKKAMFVALLKEAPRAVLKRIKEEILSKVLQYEEQTGDHNFDPEDFDELCKEALGSLEKYFLAENRA